MSHPIVKTIDFLPDRYRQATKRRRTSYWRAIVAVLFVAVFAAAAGGVVLVQREVRREYDLVAAKYSAATAADLRLKAKEAQLGELQGYADLLTFLRHPWPRSRIMQELFALLPEGVTIDTLRIVSEVRAVAATGEASAVGTEATEKNVGTDLAALREQVAGADLVVRVEGTTDDPPALHAYVQRLVGPGFFADAEVEQIEAVRNGNVRTSKFTARVVVRPGWGMPGGPSEENLPPLQTVEPVVAAADTSLVDAAGDAEAVR